MRKLISFLLLCTTIQSYAQFNDFFQYKALAAYANATYGLEMGIPKDMYVMTYTDAETWTDRNLHNPYIKGGGMALAEDKNSMIVFPFIELMGQRCCATDWTDKNYMNIGFIAKVLADSTHTTATNQVLTNSKLCGGADTIIISEMTINPSCSKRNPVCNYQFSKQVNILMSKKGFLPMYFRLYFNKEGVKHKSQTIANVLQVMKFGNKNDFIERKRKDQQYGNFKTFLKENNYTKYFPMTPDFYSLP